MKFLLIRSQLKKILNNDQIQVPDKRLNDILMSYYFTHSLLRGKTFNEKELEYKNTLGEINFYSISERFDYLYGSIFFTNPNRFMIIFNPFSPPQNFPDSISKERPFKGLVCEHIYRTFAYITDPNMETNCIKRGKIRSDIFPTNAERTILYKAKLRAAYHDYTVFLYDMLAHIDSLAVQKILMILM